MMLSLISLVLSFAFAAPSGDPSQRVWSDLPAFTAVFENQDERGLTSDCYDNRWEGDAPALLPRVKNPSPEIKRWEAAEGVNYLNEETYASTGGRYPNPVRIWESEPYPIGNGRIAASVFHGSGRDRYALNEVSFWSGGRNAGTINAKGDKTFGPHGPEVLDDAFGGYQPVGDLMVDFGKPAKKGRFRREILLDKGMVHCSAERGGAGIESSAFSSYPDQVMVIHYTSSRRKKLDATISYATQRRGDIVKADGSSLTLTCRLPNGMECVARAVPRISGGALAIEGDGIRVSGADAFDIIVAIETNYKMDFSAGWRGEDALKRVGNRMASALPLSYKELLEHHLKDYTGLYDRLSLDLPDPCDRRTAMPTYMRLAEYKADPTDTGLEEIFFNFGRYLMIQTSRPGSLPAGLQGIWNGMVNAPWGNDYHSNINLQMVYWLPEVANLSECHLSMLDYLYAMREPNRIATREYLGAVGDTLGRNTGGWVVYTSHNPFGGHGWQVNLPGSAWYGLHMWEHYAFTLDEGYLRDEAYPMMKELCDFWSAHLKTLGEGGEGFCSEYRPVDVSAFPELSRIKAGTLVVPAGWSPEHGPRGEDGVSHDQQIVSELFIHTVQAARILGVDKAWADSLSVICGRLLPPQIGRKGNLMEWMIDRDPETDHRHTSHLFAVYPGSTITPSGTPALSDAARKSLEMRRNSGDSLRSWAWTWRSMLWARLRNGAKAHEMMEGLLSNNVLDNLFTSHKLPLQIDGNYGISAAMLEMLVQSHDGGLTLLPSKIPQWPYGSVRGVKARGNIEVSFSWKDGVVTDWTLMSPDPEAVLLTVNGRTIEVTPEKS